MSSNINKKDVNIPKLEYEISTLKNMQSTWEGYDFVPPETVGGGAAVAQIEAIGKDYEKMYKSFLTLMENTVSYLQLVDNKFTATDEEMANKLS